MLRLTIIGAESLGVRGLCCLVTTDSRRVLIDPGVSLGFVRGGLPPHPLQVAAGRAARARIVRELARATDVVVSHFHGDHVPLSDANPYQLALTDLPTQPRDQRWWASPPTRSPLVRRYEELRSALDAGLQPTEGISDGWLTFSDPVPHGCAGTSLGGVVMTRIQCGDEVFVHASDIQLLDSSAIDRILSYRPSTVLTAGPPLYLRSLSVSDRQAAFENAIRLARGVETLILDHHVMRSLDGIEWLDEVSAEAGRRVYCAADYMGQSHQLLEARRAELYVTMPVPPDWHARYAAGEASVDPYVERSRVLGHGVTGRWRAAC